MNGRSHVDDYRVQRTILQNALCHGIYTVFNGFRLRLSRNCYIGNFGGEERRTFAYLPFFLFDFERTEYYNAKPHIREHSIA